MLTDLTVKVEKATYDFDQKLVAFVRDLSKALVDGWQLTDLPVVLNAALLDLIPALQEVKALTPESQENLQGFLRAHLNSSLDMAAAIGILK